MLLLNLQPGLTFGAPRLGYRKKNLKKCLRQHPKIAAKMLAFTRFIVRASKTSTTLAFSPGFNHERVHVTKKRHATHVQMPSSIPHIETNSQGKRQAHSIPGR